MLLEKTFQDCIGSPGRFKYGRVLFIGSESYDAATITVLQGLKQLGFTVLTIGKPNINSWFCNQVIEDPLKVKFDFVLSNLHWGTRWSYYEQYNLKRWPCVLIDGDDVGHWTWRKKLSVYQARYAKRPPLYEVMDWKLQQFRWMEDVGDYEPDVLFVSQKAPGTPGIYLPFGIHMEYLTRYCRVDAKRSPIDFTNIPGAGPKRQAVTRYIKEHGLPGRYSNVAVRGRTAAPAGIAYEVAKDKSVHGYYRWTIGADYFALLNRTRVFIYPGVAPTWWDSKRPWEALASGCMLMLEKPTVDMSAYPVTEIQSEQCLYSTFEELTEKCQQLIRRPSELEATRKSTYSKALRYFTPAPIARYFLAEVLKVL